MINVTVRQTQPYFLFSKAVAHVEPNDWEKKKSSHDIIHLPLIDHGDRRASWRTVESPRETQERVCIGLDKVKAVSDTSMYRFLWPTTNSQTIAGTLVETGHK